ncbi:MAG: lysine biosynthesis protein LysX [Cenarchaeum sp. SB0665_bin_23]|nr:lysine biosynthesis protein LysX [Cenarchaeum sp. SB0667_bin_13]MXY61535.1 lysine biosynthesis protein LysX [Cenarchaeum sp. SB0665_bin_23]MXZ94203.1 lysine biosynthesis protein LysX [Cenarchaeum sp. SB0666_bin_15]MYB46796.1 lysine biosynthesis protein LysX [Cenarchaeum sp. SB0662_bin_33]MYC80417.1 lysine biosynthesis protein LysX [Cenarchaeum sp. SB0661_bin_35]MYD58194.1 lysine biosynthesis protein LysX [Cenarchaeum sp. SB0678_bin_8]MYG33709.1 lysine biosynthesis protein LysX [Cenarchaeum
MVRVGIAYDRLRLEEKMLSKAAQNMGHDTVLYDVKQARTGTEDTGIDAGDVVLERCVSYYRGLHFTSYLEFLGIPVINRFQVASICGDKMFVTLLLKKHNVPTPTTHFAYSAESASSMLRQIGYPKVIKPVVGSWGRGIIPLRDQDATDAVIEIRKVTDTPLDRIYYLQDIIDRPPRDIRVITIDNIPIAAMYRNAEGFRTNVSVGGDPEPCSYTGEIGEMAARASKAVGGGILGIDMMEDSKRGIMVHEVNNTVEFRGISKVSDVDIADSMVRYAVSQLRK